MGSYVPNTQEERQAMLEAAGYASMDDLFRDIPEEVKLKGGLNIPEGLSELEVKRKMQSIAAKNKVFPTIPPLHPGRGGQRDIQGKSADCLHPLSGGDQPGNPAVHL